MLNKHQYYCDHHAYYHHLQGWSIDLSSAATLYNNWSTYGPLWNFGLTINNGPFSLGDPNPKWITSALMSFSANPTSESKVTYICIYYVKSARGTCSSVQCNTAVCDFQGICCCLLDKTLSRALNHNPLCCLIYITPFQIKLLYKTNVPYLLQTVK